VEKENTTTTTMTDWDGKDLIVHALSQVRKKLSTGTFGTECGSDSVQALHRAHTQIHVLVSQVVNHSAHRHPVLPLVRRFILELHGKGVDIYILVVQSRQRCSQIMQVVPFKSVPFFTAFAPTFVQNMVILIGYFIYFLIGYNIPSDTGNLRTQNAAMRSRRTAPTIPIRPRIFDWPKKAGGKKMIKLASWLGAKMIKLVSCSPSGQKKRRHKGGRGAGRCMAIGSPPR
jgi:hypothetical protein